MNMRGVTRHEHAARAVVPDFAFIDPKCREPDWIGCDHPSRTALVDETLNLIECWVRRMRSRGQTDVSDDAEAAR